MGKSPTTKQEKASDARLGNDAGLWRTFGVSPANRQRRVRPPVGRDGAGGRVIYGAASPAVALIVGAGRPWIVSMISELSIPWR